MSILLQADQFGHLWENLLSLLMQHGEVINPRGQGTREIRNVTLELKNARANVLVNPARKPNYRFMVAEWLWIWYGRDDVATIAKFNKNIANFSDDGLSFNGAYGKAIMPQWPYAIQALEHDASTRQSVIQIFKQPSRKTKDVPCTLTFQMMLREGKLHGTVNMRSSDIWLGLPYDMFNFSMLLNIAAGQLNADIGSITFNLASSHLYHRDLDKAIMAANEVTRTTYSHMLGGPPPADLESVLVYAPVSVHGMKDYELDSPWSLYAEVLNSLHPFECFPLLGHLMKPEWNDNVE